jgi:uncharacterized protein (DUF1015 family)
MYLPLFWFPFVKSSNCYNRASSRERIGSAICVPRSNPMADVFPFRALRYDPSKVSPAEVITQPYDKISPSMQTRYYGSSAYNLVRIILGKAEPGDSEQNNVYTRAAGYLQQWCREGVLVRDIEPSIYFYTQAFKVPGDRSEATVERRGFIALGQLEDYDRKVVFRHEQTLSKPKADRLNLLEATRAHFGQIFMLYSDPAAEIEGALRQAAPPTVELRDEYDVLHRMWKISELSLIQAVQTGMSDKKLIIADGHHRYETALNYRNEMRQRYGGDRHSPHERVMMTCVNMDSPGLVILPTHRVVFGIDNFSIFDMFTKLREYFDIEEIGAVSDIERDLERLREAGNARTALLAITSHGGFLLRSRPGVPANRMGDFSERQRALDVVQLHKLVLEGALAMSESDIRDQKHLKYVREAHEAVDEVRGGANVAFLMNPVRITQVRDIAFAGEVLPQKSTDFYPKLLSGLTVYSLEEAAHGSAPGGH